MQGLCVVQIYGFGQIHNVTLPPFEKHTGGFHCPWVPLFSTCSSLLPPTAPMTFFFKWLLTPILLFDSWVGKNRWRRDRLPTPVFLGFPGGSAGKESACNVGDLGSIPGLGRSPEEGKGYPLQYSGLENSMDYIVHGVAKSGIQLNDSHFALWASFLSFWFKLSLYLHEVIYFFEVDALAMEEHWEDDNR